MGRASRGLVCPEQKNIRFGEFFIQNKSRNEHYLNRTMTHKEGTKKNITKLYFLRRYPRDFPVEINAPGRRRVPCWRIFNPAGRFFSLYQSLPCWVPAHQQEERIPISQERVRILQFFNASGFMVCELHKQIPKKRALNKRKR